MNPMFIIAVPLALVFVGMVWNGIGLTFDQPSASGEQDPTKRAVADGEAYRRLFETKRKETIVRQKRVGQYAWVLMIAFIGSFIWLYNYTVNKTVAASQIAALQTMPVEDGKDMVLAVTLKDGSTAKYRIQSSPPASLGVATKEEVSQQKVSSYDLEQSGAILSIGSTPLPLGVALKVSADPTIKKE
jgi:cell division protein YceG involved in septum cleavage